jgi:branched-chain amino acid transport system permease protein
MSSEAVTIRRWTRLSIGATTTVAAVGVALAFVPVAFSANVTDKLTTLFVFVILASMWNALAGYAGLVSVGQQAFFGLGAYATIKLSQHGVAVYPALVLGGLLAGAVAIPISLFMLRLRGGEFAIGMWVVAEVCLGLVILDGTVNGLTGTSLIAIGEYAPDDRRAYTYWTALGVMVVLTLVGFLLLRSSTGASLQAIRDDEDAAASVGVRVLQGKGVVFVLASAGCGLAGALWLATNINYQPASYFGVQWTAYMIFMALLGGLGTFEGPVLGAIVFFVIDDQFGTGSYGVWYLVGLGATAVLFALFLPRGIWGTVEDRFGIHLLPVGYQLDGITAAAQRRAPAEPEGSSIQS